jgi:hypothetical protein
MSSIKWLHWLKLKSMSHQKILEEISGNSVWRNTENMGGTNINILLFLLRIQEDGVFGGD